MPSTLFGRPSAEPYRARRKASQILLSPTAISHLWNPYLVSKLEFLAPLRARTVSYHRSPHDRMAPGVRYRSAVADIPLPFQVGGAQNSTTNRRKDCLLLSRIRRVTKCAITQTLLVLLVSRPVPRLSTGIFPFFVFRPYPSSLLKTLAGYRRKMPVARARPIGYA
jgi:hypothetical protein